MINNEEQLREYFRYHPPQTEERKQAHNAVNDAAFEFAKVVLATVKNERMRQSAFDQIQIARMLANQGITLEEIEKNDR